MAFEVIVQVCLCGYEVLDYCSHPTCPGLVSYADRDAEYLVVVDVTAGVLID
jgi:hypothetical protein